jgi:TonB family protein
MNSRSLIISLGLHVLFGLVMIWVSQTHAPARRPLPVATVVKLLRPAAINVPTPTDQIKFPEPKPDKKPAKEQEVTPEKKPPLEIPTKKPKGETVTEKPEHGTPGESNTPKVPKELIGEGVTLKLKNPGFEYDFYLGIIQSKLEQNFRPPPGKLSAKAVVSFAIQKSGEVTDIQIVQPSGNLLVDQAAQRAVRAAGRFPPLPAQYGSEQLAINIEFVANPGTGR